MAALYELQDEYLQLWEMASDPDIDPEAVYDTMEAIELEIDDKAEGYAKIINMLNADAKAIGDEIKRLQARKAAMEGNSKRMKERLQNAMEATGKRSIKTPLFSLRIQKNPPRVVLDDIVPEPWLVEQPPKVDTKGIMAALKAGDRLEFAHLEQDESLRIR